MLTGGSTVVWPMKVVIIIGYSPTSQKPVWNDTLKFEVTKKDEFVNICVWSRFADKNEKDMLVGYVSVITFI